MESGMNVILLGPPGVGKGTQGVLLAEGRSWKHLSTGDIHRANRREGTALGQEAQKYMDAGELVPDELYVRGGRIELDLPYTQTRILG